MWEQALWIALFVYLLLGCLVPRDPTQCNFIGALIGGAASLIGASKQRKEQRRINEANRPVNQVREWEEAGINPLYGISSGGYVQHQAASIGDSYAEAGARFGQAFDQHRAEKLAQTELKTENTALKQKLDKLADPSEPSYMSQYGGILPLPRQGEPDVQEGVSDGARNGARPLSGLPDSGKLIERLDGVRPDDAVRGTVPYVGATGAIIPGPNPETQMGIDEVFGWGMMEVGGLFKQFNDDIWDWRNKREWEAMSRNTWRRMKKPVPYDPDKNPPLRNSYGKPGRPTGF